MSTSITNTLFRFTTMRSPELLSQDAKERNFIYHPDPTDFGHFHELIDSPDPDPATQLEAWRSLADSYSFITDKETIITTVGSNVYNFASWLAKNRELLVPGYDLAANCPDFTLADPLSSTNLLKAWDEVFCLMVKEGYEDLRDIWLAIIVADFFLTNYLDETTYKNAFAKVVIPSELFGKAELATTPGAESPVLTKKLLKDLDAVLSKKKIVLLNNAISELKKAQKKYDDNFTSSFTAAKKTYDDAIAPEVYGNVAYNEEGQLVIADPFAITPFEFTPNDQMDRDALESHLSPVSLDLADNLDLFSLSLFQDAYDRLNEEVQKETAVLMETTTVSTPLLQIGGALLPLEEDMPLLGQQFGFVAKAEPLTGSLYRIFLSVNMGYADADAVSASYSVTTTGTTSGTSFNDSSSGNTLVLELFPDGVALTGTFTVTGTITLSNGDELSFTTALTTTTLSKGRMTLALLDTSGTTIVPFVPSGFGIKRLGIADYRRVEQTVCCYVPGEVSHIENVMAREYREKSSRRLRRSEETTTLETQSEKEQLTDTTSTDRYEMQQQVSEVLNQDIQTSAHTEGKIGAFSVGSNFAFNTSKQHSNSQAVTYAQDVTERAMERVVQKVREERVFKVVEEFEEQNKHGYDNRKGNVHVSGVYRWIDKIFKNQVYNYGKRLMYEFMVPEPAAFHKLAMKQLPANAATVITKPIDPRQAGLADFRSIDQHTFAYWSAAYNVELEAPPAPLIYIGKSFGFRFESSQNNIEHCAKDADLNIPEGYRATAAKVHLSAMENNDGTPVKVISVKVGDYPYKTTTASAAVDDGTPGYVTISKFTGSIPVSFANANYFVGNINVSVQSECTPEHYQQWQMKTFNAIIEAYEEKLAAFNNTVQQTSKATNPRFFRQIENTVLRKNCISYLAGPNMGLNFILGNTAADVRVNQVDALDKYAGLIKFLEQAFEWDVISYMFYPFYWGKRNKWQELYQQDIDDPLFRSFLQSGMARVVVTVRPGFEDAVMHFMATGQVWAGGEVPVIGDDLYMSIVEEMKQPGYYVDETWESRVPTTLTVIQAGSIGLNAEGLPCDCGDMDSGIEQTEALMTAEEEPTGG